MALQIALWWLAVQIIGIAALPLTTFLLRSLPDCGYAFSKSLGLLVISYLVWLLAMLGLGSFSGGLVLLALLVVAGGGVLLLRLQGIPLHPAAFGAWLRGRVQQHGRRLLFSEQVFLAALIGLALMRAHSYGFVGPHPWGTERPMDFAFFNAIRYSNTFPPPDPWLAGYSINYYYFGYLMMAVVALISGLEPAVAYNLALALIFALTAQGVASIVNTLITLAQPATIAGDAPRRLPARIGRVLAPLLGVVLVLAAANQAGALQVLVGDNRVSVLDARQLAAAVGQALRASDTITLPYPANTAPSDFGSFSTLERGERIDNFDWWWPSRALWDEFQDGATGTTLRRYNITEFPFFSFWLGDMHPHVMALPFNLLALALALATVARTSLPPFAQQRTGWLELLLTGLILGSMYTINSWDMPTYLLLYGGALLVLTVRVAGSMAAINWLTYGKLAGMVLLTQYLLFLPFHLTFHSLVGFAEPWLDVPILSRLSAIVAPVTAGRSDLHSFLIIFGLFLLPLLALLYLMPATAPATTTHATSPTDDTAEAPPAPTTAEAPAPTGGGRIRVGQSGTQGALLIERVEPVEQQATTAAPRLALLGDTLPWLPLILLPVGLVLQFPLLALAGLMTFAVAQALRHATQPALAYAALVIALGSAICFGTEVIYIRDVFNNRMNTIFKFYYQVWLLWGTLTAFAVWWLLAVPRLHWQRLLAGGVLLLWLPLLLGSLVYPAINLRNLARDGQFYGLAGRTPRENSPAGAAATAWIRANVPSGSVILEAVGEGGGSYNGEGFAAISASTGRPTILGWYGHQVQWRGGDEAARAELEPRRLDVATIYSTTDLARARELLAKYSVDYVFVGDLEQRSASPEALAKFAQLGEVAFQQDNITIYRLTTEPQPPR